jgi:hypothetical protein
MGGGFTGSVFNIAMASGWEIGWIRVTGGFVSEIRVIIVATNPPATAPQEKKMTFFLHIPWSLHWVIYIWSDQMKPPDSGAPAP